MGHRHPVQAAAEMWAGQVKEMGLTKAWLGGEKQISQFPVPEKPGLLPQLSWACQHHRKEHIRVTMCSCPALLHDSHAHKP